jgi:Uma2 family endonuclease
VPTDEPMRVPGASTRGDGIIQALERRSPRVTALRAMEPRSRVPRPKVEDGKSDRRSFRRSAVVHWPDMGEFARLIEAPLGPTELAARWRDLSADATFQDVAAKIELTEWGEILLTPVGKTHGLTAMRLAEGLRRALGGHTMAEVGVATSLGVRAPDVAWCSDAYLHAHPEELPLSAAPELCIEIVSAHNALPKLREKALAYVRAGAREAWLVYADSRLVEIYGQDGRRTATEFDVEVAALFTA